MALAWQWGQRPWGRRLALAGWRPEASWGSDDLRRRLKRPASRSARTSKSSARPEVADRSSQVLFALSAGPVENRHRAGRDGDGLLGAHGHGAAGGTGCGGAETLLALYSRHSPSPNSEKCGNSAKRGAVGRGEITRARTSSTCLGHMRGAPAHTHTHKHSLSLPPSLPPSLPRSLSLSLALSLSVSLLNDTSPMMYLNVMMHLRMLQCRMALAQDWTEA